MSGKLLRDAEQNAPVKKVLTFGDTPLRKVEPLQEQTPVINRTPAENQSPPEINRSTPSVSYQPPLQTEPLRKTEGVILPDNTPHLRLPYLVLEQTLRKLKPAPRVVLEELYRAAAGWHSDECIISIAKLSGHCQIKPTQVRQYLKELESRGYIARIENVIGGRDVEARGIKIKVNLARLTPPEKRTPSENRPRPKTEANKDSIKETNKKGDELSLNIKNCPDCQGTGFWYPSGIEQGVAKCTHSKLTNTT